MSLIEFDGWEDFIDSGDSRPSRMSSSQREQFEEYLAQLNINSEAQKQPFEFLFTDIIKPERFIYNFKGAFQNSSHVYDTYAGVTDDAKSCIAINPQMRKVSHLLFPNWLDNTLKVADHIVLFYIQILKNDVCVKLPKHGVETSRYLQLQTYDCKDIRNAGVNLKEIYSGRNDHAHRLKEENGKHKLIKLNRNRIRNDKIKLFEAAFLRLQLAFLTANPTYNLN